MRVVRVPLGERSYSILIGTGLLARLGHHCRRLGLGPRCAVISDHRVLRHHGVPALDGLRREGLVPVVISVPPGEASKTLALAGRCYDEMARHRLERASFVVALGGGVVGDLAGFVAATYLRGIPFVQVPTTLLAQVDSSVGGKVGVNLRAGKNLVGAFHQPRLVLCDLDTLRTLPARELRAGMAEVVKYGIIQDAPFFRRLERDLEKLLALREDVLASVVSRCCQIKARVVGRDETEGGLRAMLNFGHTIGHALEATAGYGRYLHGEAIAIGQVAAARLSSALLDMPAAEAERIRVLFERIGLPTQLKLSGPGRKQLRRAMLLDKKVSGGQVRFVLASRIGKVQLNQSVPGPLLDEVLSHVASREHRS